MSKIGVCNACGGSVHIEGICAGRPGIPPMHPRMSRADVEAFIRDDKFRMRVRVILGLPLDASDDTITECLLDLIEDTTPTLPGMTVAEPVDLVAVEPANDVTPATKRSA